MRQRQHTLKGAERFKPNIRNTKPFNISKMILSKFRQFLFYHNQTQCDIGLESVWYKFHFSTVLLFWSQENLKNSNFYLASWSFEVLASWSLESVWYQFYQTAQVARHCNGYQCRKGNVWITQDTTLEGVGLDKSTLINWWRCDASWTLEVTYRHLFT